MLDLDCGGVSDGTRVHQWDGAPASSQLWVVEPSNDGTVKIKSNLAGKLLDVVGMSTENATPLQIWRDVDGANQYWTIAEVTRKPKASAKATAAKAKAAAAAAAENVADAAVDAAEEVVKAAKKAAKKPAVKKAAKTVNDTVKAVADVVKPAADEAVKAEIGRAHV